MSLYSDDDSPYSSQTDMSYDTKEGNEDINETVGDSQGNSEGVPDNEDVEDMYKLFLLYLEEKAEQERSEEEKLAEALRRYIANQRAKLQLGEIIFGSDNDNLMSPSDLGYYRNPPYELADSSMYSRIRRAYTSPRADMFWGNFIPEKRASSFAVGPDYIDALERLQGLALALSGDSNGEYPQYRGLLGVSTILNSSSSYQ